MTYNQLIEYTNELSFIKEANLEVNKIKFENTKTGKNRRISIYFKDHKYPCWVSLWKGEGKYTQFGPAYCTGVTGEDKEYWSEEIRYKLVQFIYERFWVWIKGIDRLYDYMVLGHTNNKYDYFSHNQFTPEIFSRIIDDGFDTHYYAYKKTLYEDFDYLLGPKLHIKLYNEDVKDNLYPQSFGEINYIIDSNRKSRSEEEIKELLDKNFIRIGF